MKTEVNDNANHTSNSASQQSKGGRSQSGLRIHNERRILSLIRKEGALPKAKISIQAGLSAQAVTVIINSLEVENLLIRKDIKKGSIGQPSIPFALNPDGAFGIGLKIGRRSFDLTLIDFVGNVRATLHKICDYPTVEGLLSFLKGGIKQLMLNLSNDYVCRVKGIGIATPYELWGWAEEAGAPIEALNEWKEFNLVEGVSKISDLPVYICNDDTAACSAELSFGNPNGFTHFLYAFIGTFIGGGVVIDSSLLTGNAGAIGSLPVPLIKPNGELGTQQLIMKSSLFVLENMLNNTDYDTQQLHNAEDYWHECSDVVDQWIEQAAEGLTYAALNSAAIFEAEAIVIDGTFPEFVRDKIVDLTKNKIKASDLRGLSPLQCVSGTIGSKAQSVGSANLPLLATYFQDLDLSL
ncbi:ROK family transcriptional regulator [Pseudocolwellia sp. HL-MZ19]|uniref:ROK family transcriptional regulator n=1 Tax=unclassified Pseudocolwellia TaxID=2848178 RepID=UPI003CE85224